MGTRTLILVRHGQYEADEAHVGYGKLTPLGVRQARRTAKRIQGYPIRSIYSSTMPRAVETAKLIRKNLGRVPLRFSHLLREGIPMPAPGTTGEQRSRMRQTRKRVDRAFARYFQPTRGADRYELIVAHGNVIRYWLRVAIGDSPTRWWRFWPMNCGLSIVVIPADGPTRIQSINDVGHLPLRMQTVT
jgi:serine/threonine-protein phosphatase PGAM5